MKRVIYVSIDLEKAYDKVNRVVVGATKTGTGGRGVCGAIQYLYMNCEVRARVGERHSERFEVDQGVRQGCTLSPWLFNVFLDTIAKETREGFTGVRLGDEIVVVLLLLMTCVLDGTCTMWSHSCSLHDTVEMMVMVLVTAHNVALHHFL